jgi:hypothetical protein
MNRWLVFLFLCSGSAFADDQSQKIANFYKNLNHEHMDLVAQFYDQNAEFIDPVVDVHGVPALRNYYAGLYKDVKSIRFGGNQGKVIYHRDYFDMGAFIYERVPVLDRVIAYVKGKLSAQ